MSSAPEHPIDRETEKIDAFPSSLGGTTVLIAGPVDPTEYALGLRALQRFGTPNDAAMIVTTTDSADRTLAAYDSLSTGSKRQSLALVDTTSERQYVTALYDETPVVFIPTSSDLERLVLALSELTGNRLPSNGTQHLVVRSLTPILQEAPLHRVCRVLERISGLRRGDGITALGIDYTAHDEETMNALMDLVDGVVWVTRTAEDELEFEYRPTRRREPSMR